MTQDPRHSDAGLKHLLTLPAVYTLAASMLGTRRAGWLIDEHVRPFDGCRILDLGCGPGRQVGFLSDRIGAYHGVDVNPSYIAAARRQADGRPYMTFESADVLSYSPPSSDRFDIVMALGLLHHLDDAAAARLVAIAHGALAPGGRLVTYDGVYVDGQHPVARWLLAHDRGRAVRTVDGYRALVRPLFPDHTVQVLHDTLRLPYTTVVMTCILPERP